MINIKNHLLAFAQREQINTAGFVFCDRNVVVEKIKTVMINEVAPADEGDYFFSNKKQPAYMQTTKMLFGQAGLEIQTAEDLLGLGVYPTVAVKAGKSGYNIASGTIKEHLPLLEEEISLFANLRAIMLMGDVAKKAFNLLAKKQTGKNAVVSGSTYKIRTGQYFYKNIRVFPSYIMTGGNILIEKSKQKMVAEDITAMMKLL